MSQLKAILSKWLLPTVALIMCVCFGSCSVSITPGSFEEDKKAVEQKIVEFHRQLAKREFQTIHGDMHPGLQASDIKEVLIGRLVAERDQLGEPKEVTDSRIEVIMGAPVQVRAVYNVKFERKDVTETFNYIKEGSSYKLANYDISAGTAAIPKGSLQGFDPRK